MKTADDLHFLIHTLTIPEKGYFKKYYAARQGASADAYLQMFDLIASQKTYDEATVLKKLGNKAIAAYYPKARLRLWDMIMQCLRDYETENAEEKRTIEMLGNARILLKRGLWQHGYNELSKAYETAVKNQLFELALYCLQLMIRFTPHHFKKPVERLEEYRRIETEWDTMAGHAVTYRNMSLLNLKSAVMFSSFTNDLQGCNTISEQIKALDEKKFRNAHPLLYIQYLSIKGANAYYLRNFEHAEQTQQTILDVCDRNTRSEYLTCYLIASNNLITLKYKAGEHEVALRMAQESYRRLREIKNDIVYQSKIISFGIVYSAIFIENGDMESISMFCNDLEKSLARYRGNFRPHSLWQIYLILIKMHFIAGNYRMVIKHINLLLGENKITEDSLLHIELRTYALCIHFSRQDEDLVESIYRSAEKKMTALPQHTAVFLKPFIYTLAHANHQQLQKTLGDLLNLLRGTDRSNLPMQQEGLLVTLLHWLRILLEGRQGLTL